MSIESVTENLLTHNHLSSEQLFDLLNHMNKRHLDYADLYFQSSYHEAWSLENGIIKEGSFNIDQGAGVRAIIGDKTGFAYTDSISLLSLKNSAEAARAISLKSNQSIVQAFKTVKPIQRYQSLDPISSYPKEEKIMLLRQVDSYARKIDHRVTEVNASLSGVYEEVLIAASDGTFAVDIRPLVRLSINILVEEDGRRESGNASGGGRFSYSYFSSLIKVSGLTVFEQYAQDAVKMALINLSAKAAPAGVMPVVLGSGWPAVLLHEAVGHGLEGDFNRKGTSLFSGKIGQKVTSALCTVVDDGTLQDRRGSLTIDDEGVPSQKTCLIEGGILKGYLHDKMSARLLGVEPTGNARRESYASLPIPRMTNTYMLPGESTSQEIIESVKQGVYAPNFSGGQVDITSGKFVFTTSEAYLIENGKITCPIKGATLIGSGIEVMQNIEMVGNDFQLDSGVGVCGKDGQSVPVGVGQPTIKVSQLTVGGTQ